jgi:hypothetical protein
MKGVQGVVLSMQTTDSLQPHLCGVESHVGAAIEHLLHCLLGCLQSGIGGCLGRSLGACRGSSKPPPLASRCYFQGRCSTTALLISKGAPFMTALKAA